VCYCVYPTHHCHTQAILECANLLFFKHLNGFVSILCSTSMIHPHSIVEHFQPNMQMFPDPGWHQFCHNNLGIIRRGPNSIIVTAGQSFPHGIGYNTNSQYNMSTITWWPVWFCPRIRNRTGLFETWQCSAPVTPAWER